MKKRGIGLEYYRNCIVLFTPFRIIKHNPSSTIEILFKAVSRYKMPLHDTHVSVGKDLIGIKDNSEEFISP